MRKPEWLLELKALFDFPKFTELPLEIFNGLIGFVGSLQEFVEFKVVDTRATVAGQCFVCLDPSDRLLIRISALRA
jgi:hypothetical protein